MKQGLINIAKYGVLFGFAIALTYWALKDIHFQEVIDTWHNANKTPILLSGVAVMLSHYFRALRWKIMLKPLGHNFSTFSSYISILVGYGINILIPRGGELARCVNLNKLEGTPVQTSLGTVITERIIDLLILIMMMGLAFILKFDDLLATISNFLAKPENNQNAPADYTKLYILGGLFAAGVIGLLILLFSKNDKILNFREAIKNFLMGMLEGLKTIFNLEHNILFLLYSFIIWFLYYLMAYFVILAFEQTQELGFEGALMVLVLGSIAMAMPTPGGTGTYHTFVPFGLLQLYKIPEKVGVIFASIFHAWQTIVHLVIGAVSIVISQIIIKRNGKVSK
ncbi:flippase-like domain-containing protein [Cyclobacteriaceae bacterium]|nr:flippase-like domain-containing protein [Cyclobacteriaceae bacterium]